MSQYPPPPTSPAGPQNPWAQPQPSGPPQKGWFGRNWKWFVPLLIVVVLSPCRLCAGFGGWAAFWLKGQVKKSQPYQDSLAIVQNDPRVTAALGTPVKVTTGPWGAIDEDATPSTIVAYYEVEGPNGSASVMLEGEKLNAWRIRVLTVDLPGGAVNLAPGAATQPRAAP